MGHPPKVELSIEREAEILVLAKQMYRLGNKPYTIARHFGVGYEWLKRRIVPGYSGTRSNCSGFIRPIRKKPRENVPSVPKDTRDFTARFMGDPLPGRSALDKMRKQGRPL